MKSIKWFIYTAFAATALLAACGKSNNSTTASVPNNCGIQQGYNSTAGCLTMNAPQCGSSYAAGQTLGLSSSGQCVAVQCVNYGNGCTAVNASNGYYNNGTYVNGAYGYGTYGTSLPPVYGSNFNGGYYGNGYYGNGYSARPYTTGYGYSGYGYGYGYPSYGPSYGVSAGISVQF